MDWILPAMLSYPQKYTLDVVPPEKLYGKRWNELADSRENYEDFCSISIMRSRNCFSSMTNGFLPLPYQSEAGKKSKYSVSELGSMHRLSW